jgi:hypothetical protein
MRFELEEVEFMPAVLQPGVLYVSRPYSTAAHLCACGCGSKVRTPLGPTEWAATRSAAGPSLWPSVGNWQKPCRSHYVIDDGEVYWCAEWSPAEVAAGRFMEQRRREAHYAERAKTPWRRVRRWLATLFG